MGLNIQIHAEVKINGQFHHYATAYPKRNYQIFKKIAQVDDITLIHENMSSRGLPVETSFLTRWILHHEQESFGVTYLNSAEIKILHNWIDEKFGHYIDNYMPAFRGSFFDEFTQQSDNCAWEGVQDVQYVVAFY